MLYFLLSLNILLRESISGSVLFAESQTAERSGTEFRETNSVTLNPGVILLHAQQMQQVRLQHAMGEPLPNRRPVSYDCTVHLEKPPSQRVLHTTTGYFTSWAVWQTAFCAGLSFSSTSVWLEDVVKNPFHRSECQRGGILPPIRQQLTPK